MSFLSKLMGGTFASNRDEGDAHFAEQRFGEARMAYERALRKGKDASPDELAAVRDRIAECLLELARGQLTAADELARVGELDQAMDCLEEAGEICDADEIAAEIADRRQRYEAQAARSLLGDEDEMTEDELLAIIAGTWTEEQADEYAALPEELGKALLAAHDGQHETAVELLEELVASADLAVEPCFALFELGKELHEVERHEDSINTLDRFLAAVDGDRESVEVQVSALLVAARSLIALERPAEADERLVRATEIDPENHGTYLNLGVFLRSRGELERSLEALNKAIELMGQINPDFRVVRELGFTYLELGRKQEAEESLAAVIEHQASRGTHEQFDPIAAVALARLYEEREDFEQAADLFRHLAVGLDTTNHFTYNLEAARLLGMSGADPGLIERYLMRAAELAGDDEQRALIAAIGPAERD